MGPESCDASGGGGCERAPFEGRSGNEDGVDENPRCGDQGGDDRTRLPDGVVGARPEIDGDQCAERLKTRSTG